MESIKYLLAASLLALSLVGCETPPPVPLAAQDFLPAVEQLQEGVLQEYLTRFDQGPNKDIQGRLEYSYYTLSPDGTKVSIEELTPALVPAFFTLFRVSDTMLRVEKSERYYKVDTFQHQIGESESLRFDGKTSILEIETPEWKFTRNLSQVADTTWRGMPAKRFVGAEYSFSIASNTNDTAQVERLYATGLGNVFTRKIRSSSTYTRELVRQLSPKQHKELLASVPERVAYIDPENTLISDTQGWAPCRDVLLIADYYNPTPDIGYPGGHYTLKRDLLPKLDLAPFASESGYLTIRFVVNCEGETGRFTTDEADLNFKPKQFPAAAVKDVALAIQTLKGWNTGRVGPDEPLADFYTYITLKFEDGKLIDLLP
ncbi:MAG: hypothetical protein AB8F78_16990 [Saprospiraceae bacterium]